MSKSKIVFQFFTAICIIVLGLVLGGFGRYAYDYLLNQPEDIVSEVVTPQGKTYAIIPYLPEDSSVIANVRSALEGAGIDYIVKDDHVMVSPDKTALVMDCLSAANLIPGTEHYTLMDVTADPEKDPQRYKFQQRLATQNMLAKMIPTMLGGVDEAKVLLLDSSGKVVIKTKPGRIITAEEVVELKKHINAVENGIKPENIEVVDIDGQKL